MVQVERLQDYTVTDNGCWNWDRCLSEDGYGKRACKTCAKELRVK